MLHDRSEHNQWISNDEWLSGEASFAGPPPKAAKNHAPRVDLARIASIDFS